MQNEYTFGRVDGDHLQCPSGLIIAQMQRAFGALTPRRHRDRGRYSRVLQHVQDSGLANLVSASCLSESNSHGTTYHDYVPHNVSGGAGRGTDLAEQPLGGGAVIEEVHSSRPAASGIAARASPTQGLTVMTFTDELLANAERYAAAFAQGDVPIHPPADRRRRLHGCPAQSLWAAGAAGR